MARPTLTATYRLQLNAGFTLVQTRGHVDYFHELGVSHLYLSPILAARRGSMHGYDVVDPTRVNAEIGTEGDLRALADALHERDMGLVVDIVPNHMGVGPENAYWDDVLARGERSPYARWFDIDWGDAHKVVIPILGDELDRVLERGELSVRVPKGEPPRIVYYGQSLPVDPVSAPEELQLATVDPEETSELARLYSGKDGRERLRALLDVQHYRLAFWRRGPAEVNYRRFFDVNDLVALRMEDAQVFDETHAYVLRLVRDGVIDGLRVDHIDGLLDPVAYLERLRAAVGDDVPIVVEKILSKGERLRTNWPVQGTTGYDFMNDIEDLFIDPAGFAKIEATYRRERRLGRTTFMVAARAAKRQALEGALHADVDRLARRLQPIARAAGKRWTLAQLAEGVVAFITALPVYRTYIRPGEIAGDDRALIERAARGGSDEVATFVGDTMLAHPEFAQRLQQVSGPATAKGVEDTALYQYIPLASVNEVGGGPDRSLENAVSRFHANNVERVRQWPLAFTATNTHDTKRSADLRARLDVLSEIAPEWERSVKRWRRLNAKHRLTVKGRLAPDSNTEYLIYQTLIALWPPSRPGRRVDDVPDRVWRDSTRDRLIEYTIKAARESKTRTSWVEPNGAYEDAVKRFVTAILTPSEDAPFLVDVARLVSCIATAGAWNSLARVAVHLTSPGTPDTYQGDELWNFTLVDPDNRRPVDYVRRTTLLHAATPDLSGPPDPYDGRRKLHVVQRLLTLRRDQPDLFTRGTYRPLIATGARRDNVVAFVRSFEQHHVVTIAPRLICSLLKAAPSEWWADTAIELPDDVRGSILQSRLVERETTPTHGKLELAALLRVIPFDVLAG